jgi:hypothetical protein
MLFYGGGVVFGARFGAWLLAAASASAAAAAAASLPPTPAAWNSTAGIMSGGADSQAGLVNSSSGSSSANASSVFAFSAFACALTIVLTIALRRADWLQVRGQVEASTAPTNSRIFPIKHAFSFHHTRTIIFSGRLRQFFFDHVSRNNAKNMSHTLHCLAR